MAKPSDEIQWMLIERMGSDSNLRKAIQFDNGSEQEVINASAIASATMIQCILDWLDKKYAE